MSNYRKSNLIPKARVVFNPANKKHVLDFARFVKYNGWKNGCSYYLEDPFSDIPSMIRYKIADYSVSRLLEKV